jgi:serine protease Do
MNAWKTAALTAALVAAAAVGAVFTPPAHGQATTRATPRATAPRARALDVFGARGSQIGVAIRDVGEDDAKADRLTMQTGVIVEEVTADSPAEKAGIKTGDVVVEFDGERVRSVRQFTRLVQETPAGRRTPAVVIRGGQRVTVSIEPRENDRLSLLRDLDGVRALGDFGRDFYFEAPVPPVPPARPVPPTPPAPPAFPFDFQSFVWRSGSGLGMTVTDLSEQLANYFGTKDGVLVTAVTDNSAAAKAGLKAGDVITSFNSGSVTDGSDLRRRIQRLDDGDEFTVGIVRDKKSLTLKWKVESSRTRRTSRTVI